MDRTCWERKRMAYAFECGCAESPLRLCPAAIIPNRPVPLCAQSCTKKKGGSHLCLYNSVICLDNCVFLWTNAFLTVFMAFYLAHTATNSHKNSHVHYTRRSLLNHISFVSMREILPRAVTKYTCLQKLLKWLRVCKTLKRPILAEYKILLDVS